MRRMRGRASLMALAVGLTSMLLTAAPAVAGGGGGGGGLCRGFAHGDVIRLRDNCFEGVGHVVGQGTMLRVENLGRLPHTFTAVDGSFDSGVVDPGEFVDLQPDSVGAIPVYCTLHSDRQGHGMAGLLVVTDGSTGTGAAAAGAGDTGTGVGGDRAVPLAMLVAGIVAAAVIVHRGRGPAGSDRASDALSPGR